MPAPKKYSDCKSDADRKALAKSILAMREDGRPWDGPEGIVAEGIVSGAPQGRKLLVEFGPLRKGRKIGTGNGIAPSYDRTAEFRAEESARRQAKAEASRKASAKAERAAKRAAKAAK